MWGKKKANTTAPGKHKRGKAQCVCSRVQCPMPRQEYIQDRGQDRGTHGSGVLMESRLGAEGSGTSTAVNRGEELVNYSPGSKPILAYFCNQVLS